MATQKRRMVFCGDCGFAGPTLEAHVGYKWYYFLLGITGVGLLPLAILLVVLGNRTVASCPACGSKKSISPLTGPPDINAKEVWSEAAKADEKRFARNKNLTAVVLLLVMIVAFVLVLVFLPELSA